MNGLRYHICCALQVMIAVVLVAIPLFALAGMWLAGRLEWHGD